MSESENSLLIVAGEASADLHASKVMACLKQRLPQVECFGLGGEKMIQQGLGLVADPKALNVVGISEVFRALPRIRRVFSAIVQAVVERKPRAALLLDLPDFNLRLARKLKKLGVPVVYYIAPQAWAWRKGRVRQLRRRVNKLCVIFPFEESFFSQHGVAAEFVGHPLLEDALPCAQPDPHRIALVPGSRPSEIARLLPALAQAARILQQQMPNLRLVLPLAPAVDEAQVRSMLGLAGVEAELVQGGASVALGGASLALIASGTATLEAALAQVPMVVVYRVSSLTYAMVRPVFRLPYVCIVNILAGHRLVPELLQGKVRPELIAAQAWALLAEGEERGRTLAGLAQVRKALGAGRPSERVADIVAKYFSSEGTA